MTTPRPVEPAIVARAVNSRLRVGRLTQAGQAITLTQTDATTCGPTCLLAARLLLASGERAAVTGDLAQEMTASLPGREGKQLMSVLSRQQLRLQRAMNVRGLGGLPWPKALGSTPWSVARQMTEIVSTCTPGGGRRRYTVRWVSDHGPAWGSEVASIREVLASGLPVILVSGGPLVLGGEQGSRVLDAKGPEHRIRLGCNSHEAGSEAYLGDRAPVAPRGEVFEDVDRPGDRAEVLVPVADSLQEWARQVTVLLDDPTGQVSDLLWGGHDRAPTIWPQIATMPHMMRENTANAMAAMMT